MGARLASARAPSPARAAAELRKIRLGCTKIGLTDDDRRALMERLAGVRSSTKLTAEGRQKVLDHLSKAGAFKGVRQASYPEGHPRMARGLWIKLAKAGAIEDGSDRSLDAFVRRQTGGAVASARFLTDPAVAAPVIEALKAMARRAGE